MQKFHNWHNDKYAFLDLLANVDRPTSQTLEKLLFPVPRYVPKNLYIDVGLFHQNKSLPIDTPSPLLQEENLQYRKKYHAVMQVVKAPSPAFVLEHEALIDIRGFPYLCLLFEFWLVLANAQNALALSL
ncbi:hypothetical protein Lche_0858 [Legionella cherrii]|uniref:Uncharacterized protein n=1 Tax=Legionella cherrii TaxID=28084 RepID=A0A0W0S5U9_9GAMM|nr:hypothetical protein Lche_0858 [Legionella cherrii]